MRLIFGQSVDKLGLESPIVFNGIKLHRCPVGGQGLLRVMSDFSRIDMKFGMYVEFDALNDYLKMGCDELISYHIEARTKNQSTLFTCEYDNGRCN